MANGISALDSTFWARGFLSGCVLIAPDPAGVFASQLGRTGISDLGRVPLVGEHLHEIQKLNNNDLGLNCSA